MTYEIDGVQYVAVMAGFGGGLGGSYPEGTAAYRYGNEGRIVTFKREEMQYHCPRRCPER